MAVVAVVAVVAGGYHKETQVDVVQLVAGLLNQITMSKSQDVFVLTLDAKKLVLVQLNPSTFSTIVKTKNDKEYKRLGPTVQLMLFHVDFPGCAYLCCLSKLVLALSGHLKSY